MNADKAVNAKIDALSDKELNSVSGGRHQVSLKQYELLLEIRMMMDRQKS